MEVTGVAGPVDRSRATVGKSYRLAIANDHAVLMAFSSLCAPRPVAHKLPGELTSLWFNTFPINCRLCVDDASLLSIKLEALENTFALLHNREKPLVTVQRRFSPWVKSLNVPRSIHHPDASMSFAETLKKRS